MSEYEFKSAKISIADLFDDNKKTQMLRRIMLSDTVELYGKDRVIVNMRLVHLVKEENGEYIFYFLNGNFLVVQPSGRVKFVR